MLNVIETINSAVNNFVWGVPAMICIFGVGLYLSIRTGFCRSANFPTPCGQPSDKSSANGKHQTEL